MASLREVSPLEYQLLTGQLDDLPADEANCLRSRLAEKYYAYLDKLMQLKMALREYEDTAGVIQQTLAQNVNKENLV